MKLVHARIAHAAEPLESACTFGASSQLVGVHTAAPGEHPERPCAVFITAGLLHHVGPTRLHVELARRLAERGVPGLRFDLSGAGDSETSSLGGYFMERSVGEIRQAMNHLQTAHGHRRFVLVGLCSGADDALATATLDERVVGIVLLNGYAYPAGRFALHRFRRFYLPRLLMGKKLLGRLRALSHRVAGRLPGAAQDAGPSAEERRQVAMLDEDYRHVPPREDTEATLLALNRSGTDMLFVYTGSEHECYTYQGQLSAMFPSLRGRDGVVERYLRDADHTLILKRDRDVVIDWVCRWFDEARFSRRAP